MLLLWGNYAAGVGLMGRSEVFGRGWEMYITGDEEEEEVIRAEPIWKWKHLDFGPPRGTSTIFDRHLSSGSWRNVEGAFGLPSFLSAGD